MNVLRKICLQEENQEFVCAALDVEIYEALVAVLILEDVQVNQRPTPLSCYKFANKLLEICSRVALVSTKREDFGCASMTRKYTITR